YCTNLGGVPKRKLCREEEGQKAAVLALARLTVKRADGEDDPPPKSPAGKRTVSDVLEEYLDMKEVELDPSSYESYRQNLADFHGRYGARTIRSLTLKDGLEFK